MIPPSNPLRGAATVNEDIASDALADALREAPNGEGKIACLARDTIRELKKMGYALVRLPKKKGRPG